jgi:hypothetical protein
MSLAETGPPVRSLRPAVRLSTSTWARLGISQARVEATGFTKDQPDIVWMTSRVGSFLFEARYGARSLSREGVRGQRRR